MLISELRRKKCVRSFFLYLSEKVSKSKLNLNHDI